MIFNSRTISLIVSFLISVSSSIILSTWTSLSNYELIGSAFVVFILAFFIVFVILEVLVFKEIRHIQNIFAEFKTKSKSSDFGKDVNVQKISHHLYTFANKKEKEIETLKRLESFRREFLADISHELKTPVFAAQGFIHTLLDGALDDENVRDKFLTKAAKSLDDLNNLVQDLVSISQLETGEFKLQLEYFDMFLLVNEVVELSEAHASEFKVELDIDYDEDGEYTVVGDRNRISQVLKNLITNGIKYGRIDNAGKVVVRLKEKKESVLVEIKDHGPGISEEHQKRIFQRFYRVDKSRSKELGGTGLGLAIVKHVLEAHNSKINITSKPGKGAIFSFVLNKNF